MANIASIAYPFFEQGQLLTSADLNDLVKYVDFTDVQSQWTRTRFFGAGILSGMHVNWEANNQPLSVSPGLGISSKGYLFCVPEVQTFLRYDEVSLPESAFFGTDNTTTYPVWKLSDTGKKNLSEVFNKEGDCEGEHCRRCLLVLRELSLEKGQGCFNGYEKPKQKPAFTTSFYLINETLLQRLPSVPQPPMPLKIQLGGLAAPWLRRVNPAELKDAATFKSALEGIGRQGITSLKNAFTALENGGGKALDANVSFDGLEAALNQKFEQAKQGNGFRLPYFYEFLEDLVKGFEELVAMGEVVQPVPEVNIEAGWFPNFLLLGDYSNVVSKCRSPWFCANSVCREKPAGNFDSARFLYRRLDELVKNTAFDALPASPKITPGKGWQHPLSERAIPFYYKEISEVTDPVAGTTTIQKVVRPSWNYKLSLHGNSHVIPSYFPGSTSAPFADPLRHELESWGFFRVEGHANLGLQTAVAHIEAERQRLNVAFDLVCVPFGETTTKRMPETVFDDLETAFQQLRLEWILDIAASPNQSELLQFLQAMEGKLLHQTDLTRLNELATATQQKENICKYDVVQHLHNTWVNRVTPPVFSQFAAKHPGLEHLGGVQPGGTLVLVYDDAPAPASEGGAAGEEVLPVEVPSVVVADFCLPSPCCWKPQATSPMEIFGCFAPENLCGNAEAQEVFTFPAGGRLLVEANNVIYPNAASLSPHTGRWQFAPSDLPDSAFVHADTAEVTLHYLHLGQKKAAGAVQVLRLTPDFLASAQWADQGVIEVTINGMKTINAASFHWSLTFFEGTVQEGATNEDPFPGLGQVNEPVTTQITGVENPRVNFARIELAVSSAGGCTFGTGQTVKITPPPTPSAPVTPVLPPANNVGNGGNGNAAGGGRAATKKDNKSGKTERKDADDVPAGPGGTPSSDSTRHLDIRDALHQRLDRYKERLAALARKDQGMNAAALQRASLFFILPANKTTTPLRYQEFVEQLLEGYNALTPPTQAQRRQLLEVLTHDFLDKLFALGASRFDADALPNREALAKNGIDIGALLSQWRGEELGVENFGVRHR